MNRDLIKLKKELDEGKISPLEIIMCIGEQKDDFEVNLWWMAIIFSQVERATSIPPWLRTR
jgi:hypothetical protein